MLLDCVKPLSLAAEEQLAAVPPYSCQAHELARHFIEIWELAKWDDSDIGVADPELSDALETLAQCIDSLPSAEWSESAVRESEGWRVVRQKAANALRLFPGCDV
jgi:hypothetical protein